jgi:hypothetical protein
MFLVPTNVLPNRTNYKVDAGTEATWAKSSTYSSPRVDGVAARPCLISAPRVSCLIRLIR